MAVSFRMPLSGESVRRIFKVEDKVSRLFTYVEAFLSEKFEN